MFFNKSRAREYMDRYGIDYLVASEPVNVTYFTDYDNWSDKVAKLYMYSPGGPDRSPQSFAVFPRDGEPSIILDAGVAMFAEQSWVKNVHTYGDPSIDFKSAGRSVLEKKLRGIYKDKNFDTPLDALLSVLKNGSGKCVIGIDPEGFNNEELKFLSKNVPKADIRSAKQLIRLIRMVKTKESIEILTKALQINEEALMKSIRKAKVGESAGTLSSAYSAEIAKYGATVDHYLYSPSGMGASTHPSYKFTGKEAWYLDTGMFYQSHNSDTGTTILFQDAYPKEVLRDFRVLRESVSVAFESMKPGVKISTVANTLRKFLDARGYSMCPGHGHGIGMEFREIPVIAPNPKGKFSDGFINTSVDVPIEENMVLNIESPLAVFGKYSIQVEESVVITKNGYRRLVPLDRDKPIIL